MVFEDFQSLKIYSVLITAMKQGNLYQFDKTFFEYQAILLSWGTWLVIERTRLLVIRQLFRKIWVLLEKPSRLTIDTLKRGLRLSVQQEVSNEEVCCMVVNLIDRGYMKGYLSHEKQVLVLSNKSSFPLPNAC